MQNQLAHQSLDANISRIISSRYFQLPQPKNKVQVTYVWIDGTGEFLRSKTRTLAFNPKCPSEIPLWTYCGSATFQATGNFAEMLLRPRALYPNPFLLENNKLVLCDTYTFDRKPGKSNYRCACKNVMDQIADQHPLFSMAQKYTMLDDIDHEALGWPKKGHQESKEASYCGIGADTVFGRGIAQDQYEACLYAGINIAQINAEVVPAQWKFTTGPCEGINIGDELWMARYLLHRVAEGYGVVITFDPKMMAKDGRSKSTASRFTFSTAAMRELKKGRSEIESDADELRSERSTTYRFTTADEFKKREKDAEYELTSRETSLMFDCSADAGDVDEWFDTCPTPSTAVTTTHKGYVECQPASNCDPYKVSKEIVQRFCLDK